jgi:hypothetical protein
LGELSHPPSRFIERFRADHEAVFTTLSSAHHQSHLVQDGEVLRHRLAADWEVSGEGRCRRFASNGKFL